jgi:hypothetical protein
VERVDGGFDGVRLVQRVDGGCGRVRLVEGVDGGCEWLGYWKEWIVNVRS